MTEFFTPSEIMFFDFKGQKKHFDRLYQILRRNGLQFDSMEIDYKSESRFGIKAISKALTWHKYEGNDPQAAQNMVIVNGEKMRLSTFLGWSAERQDEVLGNENYKKELKAQCKAINLLFSEKLKEFAAETNSELHLKHERSSVRVLTFHFSTFAGVDIDANFGYDALVKRDRNTTDFQDKRTAFKAKAEAMIREFFEIEADRRIIVDIDCALTFFVCGS